MPSPSTSRPRRLLTTGALAAAVVSFSLSLSTTARAASPDLHVNLYGNIDYAVSKQGDAPATNAFQVPQADIFLSSDLDRLSFTSEILFDFDDGNEFTIDIDRFQLSYLFRSWLRITAGKFHNAIGYYNTAFPHGAAFFLLPTERPAMVSSIETQSLLPTLGVGLRLDGRLPIGAAGALHYDLEVTNGRGTSAGEITNVIDHNQGKAFNLRLRYEPAFLDGLIIGASAYFDEIPASVELPVTIREQVFGAHVAYVEPPWHLILEGALIRHLADGGGRFITTTGLAEAGRTFGSVTPYARFVITRFPAAIDPFYAISGVQDRGNYVSVSAGARWQVSGNLVLKLELTDDHADVDDILSAIAQAAFAF